MGNTVASTLRTVPYTIEALDGCGPRGWRLNKDFKLLTCFLLPWTALRVSSVPASPSCARDGGRAAATGPHPAPGLAAARTLGLYSLGGKPFPEIQNSFPLSLWSEQGQMATTNPITGYIDRALA